MASFREAHARSTLLHQRDPSNGQRLFDLAQAEYWIGFVAFEQGRLDEAGTWFRQYRDSGQRLAALDPKAIVIDRDGREFHERGDLVDVIQLARLPMFVEIPYEDAEG